MTKVYIELSVLELTWGGRDIPKLDLYPRWLKWLKFQIRHTTNCLLKTHPSHNRPMSNLALLKIKINNADVWTSIVHWTHGKSSLSDDSNYESILFYTMLHKKEAVCIIHSNFQTNCVVLNRQKLTWTMRTPIRIFAFSAAFLQATEILVLSSASNSSRMFTAYEFYHKYRKSKLRRWIQEQRHCDSRTKTGESVVLEFLSEPSSARIFCIFATMQASEFVLERHRPRRRKPHHISKVSNCQTENTTICTAGPTYRFINRYC